QLLPGNEIEDGEKKIDIYRHKDTSCSSNHNGTSTITYGSSSSILFPSISSVVPHGPPHAPSSSLLPKFVSYASNTSCSHSYESASRSDSSQIAPESTEPELISSLPSLGPDLTTSYSFADDISSDCTEIKTVEEKAHALHSPPQSQTQECATSGDDINPTCGTLPLTLTEDSKESIDSISIEDSPVSRKDARTLSFDTISRSLSWSYRELPCDVSPSPHSLTSRRTHSDQLKPDHHHTTMKKHTLSHDSSSVHHHHHRHKKSSSHKHHHSRSSHHTKKGVEDNWQGKRRGRADSLGCIHPSSPLYAHQHAHSRQHLHKRSNIHSLSHHRSSHHSHSSSERKQQKLKATKPRMNILIHDPFMISVREEDQVVPHHVDQSFSYVAGPFSASPFFIDPPSIHVGCSEPSYSRPAKIKPKAKKLF
ncbi:hypothetical protein ADUPG1_010553, partial [Aduncisulcus paluster]